MRVSRCAKKPSPRSGLLEATMLSHSVACAFWNLPTSQQALVNAHYAPTSFTLRPQTFESRCEPASLAKNAVGATLPLQWHHGIGCIVWHALYLLTSASYCVSSSCTSRRRRPSLRSASRSSAASVAKARASILPAGQEMA